MLTKARFETLGTINSLIQLRKTIADAFVLVRLLRKQYIWADALCIIQDNTGNKARQIPIMVIVYSSSLLTIAAIAGENADTSLLGVRISRINQVVIEVRDY